MNKVVTQDEQPVIRHVGDYFASIGPIWDAYYAGRISAVTREALLASPRRILGSLPLSERFRG
jgi:hypothetical protein